MAIQDALARFEADEILVVTRPDEEASWLEQRADGAPHEIHGIPVRRARVAADGTPLFGQRPRGRRAAAAPSGATRVLGRRSSSSTRVPRLPGVMSARCIVLRMITSPRPRVGSGRGSRHRPSSSTEMASVPPRCSSVSWIVPPWPRYPCSIALLHASVIASTVSARWSSPTPRRSSHVPTRRRTLRMTAGSDGTSIAIVAGTSVTRTSSSAMSSSAGEAESTLFSTASQADAGGALGVLAQQPPQQVDAVVDAGAAPLDEAVRVGEQRRAGGELQALLADRLALGPAERRRRGAVERLTVPVSASCSSVGGWPAELYASSPVYGSNVRKTAVAMPASGTCRSMRRAISAGEVCS